MSQIIISSGQVSSGLVADYSSPIIVAGGTATDTLISGGTVTVSSGLTDNTSMTEYGQLTVNFNGRADRTTLGDAESSGGSYYYNSMSMVVSGIANSTTINDEAKVSMFNGAQMTSTTVNSGGSFCIYGGTANNTFQYEGGHVSNTGGTMNGATLEGWGGVYASGDTAIVNSAVINSGASIYAVGRAKVNNTEINSGGTLYIYGGTASVATVNEGGCLSQGSGVVQGAIVNLGGVFYAGMYWDGDNTASALNVTENGGAVYVGSYTNYDDPDSVKMFPVDFVANSFSDLVYSKGGSGTIHSGTTATNLTATYGGITVYEGGILNGITISDSTYVSSSVWTDYDGKEQVSVYDVYETGKISVISGGTATGIVGTATGDGWDDPFYFEIAPGTVIEGTVNGEKFSTYNGALENTRTSNVKLGFLSGATVTNLDMYEGGAMVYSDAKVASINLSGSLLTIAGGAVVNGITTTPIPSSYVEEPFWGDDSDAEPVVIETMKGAAVSVYQGATVTDLNMDDKSYLYMTVASNTVIHGTSGGQAIDMENGYFADNNLGSTFVYVASTTYEYDSATGSSFEIAGGTAANLIINNGAVVAANNGGKAFNMVENGGALRVDGYDMEGISYSVASNTFSNKNLTGEVTVHKNTVAHDCIMSNGGVTVYSGGVISNFYFFQKGMGISDANIYSGAFVTNLDMTRYAYPPFHGGHVEIQSGANINGLRLQSNDFIYLSVSLESVIRNGSVDGKPFSFEDGVLSGFRTHEGMNNDLSLGEGVTAVDVWVTQCPIYTDGGVHGINVTLDRSYMYLNDGDYFENLTVATGNSTSYIDGGTTHVNYDYGSATVSSGAIVDGVTVNNGGTLIVANGGKLTGVMNFGDVTSVGCSSGAIIDFDITDKSALYVARSNDWRFNGRNTYDKPKYTITVDRQQGAGTYVLSHSTYYDTYKDFYVVDATSGYEYGYFSTYFDYEWVSEEQAYRYYFVSAYSGETIEGVTLTMDAIQIDRDDGVLDFDLVLKVESNYDPAKWVAAPTVTADLDVFTCSDVVLYVAYDDVAVVTKEYSLDGTTWTAFDGAYTATTNGTYSFRGIDANGTVSDVVSYTVSNIDMVAPTVATNLSVAYDEEGIATLSWTDATDDFSGVEGFQISFWQDGGETVTQNIPGTILIVDGLATGTWHWALQTVDYAGNVSAAVQGADFVIGEGPVPPAPAYVARGDRDGNGVSDVMFVWTGNTYAHGYWMNGSSAWWSANAFWVDPAWDNLGSYDMSGDGKADAVMFGNVVINDARAAYIGYYQDGNDVDGWVTIGFLDNKDNVAWQNKVGNLTGNADGKNSIVWYAPDMYALGAWTDGTDTWVGISGDFGGAEWTLAGCGDFDGDGKDSVLMSFNGGQLFYSVGLDGTPKGLGSANWSGWEIRAIGDFKGDGKDDLVLFHKATGSMVMCADGNVDSFDSLAQLDPGDWFVAGCGDYNGDQKDDLLVRQYSTGMLGYYSSGDTAQWVEMGYGVDMNWTVIA